MIFGLVRKNCGGNRTDKGARVQAVLTSILCTAKQQDKDVFALLVDLSTEMLNQPRSQAPSGEATKIGKSCDSPEPFRFPPAVDNLVLPKTAMPPIFNST